MMNDTSNLGPWVLGVNNVDSQRSPVFQPSSGPNAKPTMLRKADNLDLDRNGFLRSRVGRTKILSLTNAHSACSINNMILLVDNGILKRINLNDLSQVETLVTGLGNEEVSYTSIGQEVFWSNKNKKGRISNGLATFWGLNACVPPAVQANSSGSLRAGRYLVALTVEANGIESGCTGSSLVTLPSDGGIAVSVVGIDSNATSINVYISDTDGDSLFWATNIPVCSSFQIEQTGVSLELLDGIGIYPPPEGHIIREFNGRLLVAVDSVLYWSGALEPHRFRIGSDLQLFPSRIVMLESSVDGFYISCENGATWFVRGDDPDAWQPTKVSTVPVCEGAALKVEGHKIPWAQTDSLVVVWATKDGWAAGLPGGTIKYPTHGRIAMDTNAKATLAFREENSLQQILLSMRDKTAIGRFGATDRATATIIKADGTIQ
jgi:hypothetical protein